jgi:hypothetical protein
VAISDLQADADGHISERECRAIRLLAKDGWSDRVLSMTFQADESQIERHRSDRCAHPPWRPQEAWR